MCIMEWGPNRDAVPKLFKCDGGPKRDAVPKPFKLWTFSSFSFSRSLNSPRGIILSSSITSTQLLIFLLSWVTKESIIKLHKVNLCGPLLSKCSVRDNLHFVVMGQMSYIYIECETLIIYSLLDHSYDEVIFEAHLLIKMNRSSRRANSIRGRLLKTGANLIKKSHWQN